MEHHFNVDIAKDYGIEEAIILHHFYFWIVKNAINEKHFYDGLYWTYNSKKSYAKFFTYMNETKIFRSIKHLEEKNIIAKGNYNADKWDKTNWYAITKNGWNLLKDNGYETKTLPPSYQIAMFDCVKMNDGACQSEQSIIINNTDKNNITDKNNNKEKETNVSKKNAVSLDLSIVADEYKDCVNEWLAYKKERKQPYTPRGFNAFYTKLIKDSKNDPVTANAMIQKSMAANYMGVFQLDRAEMKELERTGNRNDEETLLRRAYDTLTHKQEAAIYGIDAYEFHMLTDKAREYWRNVHRNKMLAWIRKNG